VGVDQVEQLIAVQTRGRGFGFLGEPRVNVLEINLALDQQFPAK
jgi:K+-transporting ATPase ATPase C chain